MFCSAQLPDPGDILDITDENWSLGNEMIEPSVVRMARLVTPFMLEQGKGAFVNITTCAAFEPPNVPSRGARASESMDDTGPLEPRTRSPGVATPLSVACSRMSAAKPRSKRSNFAAIASDPYTTGWDTIQCDSGHQKQWDIETRSGQSCTCFLRTRSAVICPAFPRRWPMT
jgi:hypothetical protein